MLQWLSKIFGTRGTDHALLAILNWGFFILTGLIFINATFFNRATAFFFSFKEQFTNFLVITVAFCLLAFVVCVVTERCKLFAEFLQKRYIYIVYTTMFIIFILQIVYAFLIHSSLEHDVGLIILNAQAGDSTEFVWIEYFSIYPNNLVILFFFRFINRALGLFGLDTHFVQTLVVVNIIFINSAIVLVFHAVKEAFDVWKGYTAWIFMLMLMAFSPWIIVPYSDTLSMPMVVGIVFLYAKSRSAEKMQKVFFALCIGVVAYVGYLIKPSSVIPLISIVIIQLITDLRKGDYNIKYFAIYSGIAIFVTGTLFNFFVHTQTTIPFREGIAFPVEHWIKMGMQRQTVGDRYTYGAYNAEDFFFTAGFSSTQEMRRADRQVIRERLSDFGVIGYSHFLINKLRWITDDGTFHWGEFAQGNFEDMTPMQSRPRNLIFPGGDNYAYFAHFMQGIWLFILFWYFCAYFVKKDSPGVFINVCMCAIIGLLLFILLTEGRSRYLINHLPLFAIVSAHCFSSITDSIKGVFTCCNGSRKSSAQATQTTQKRKLLT
ncbi:MAG: hypothetical protein FWE20_12520 [Defluviitaleaceae bacterium]|nr:hypothetical protein [Defluviitaleaceae bacterium]